MSSASLTFGTMADRTIPMWLWSMMIIQASVFTLDNSWTPQGSVSVLRELRQRTGKTRRDKPQGLGILWSLCL